MMGAVHGELVVVAVYETVIEKKIERIAVEAASSFD